MSEDKIVYESGAIRSEKLPHYRDLPMSLLIRGGEAYREGAEKYEKDFPNPLDKNWRRGDLRFATDAIDHAFDHLIRYIENLRLRSLGKSWDTSEDHLGHLVANLGMLSEFEEAGYFDVPPEPEPEEEWDGRIDFPDGYDFPADLITDSGDTSITEKVKNLFGLGK